MRNHWRFSQILFFRNEFCFRELFVLGSRSRLAVDDVASALTVVLLVKVETVVTVFV